MVPSTGVVDEECRRMARSLKDASALLNAFRKRWTTKKAYTDDKELYDGLARVSHSVSEIQGELERIGAIVNDKDMVPNKDSPPETVLLTYSEYEDLQRVFIYLYHMLSGTNDPGRGSEFHDTWS